MSEVIVTKSNLDSLANKIGRKSRIAPPLTIPEMTEVVDEYLVCPQGTLAVTENGTVDVTGYAEAQVDVAPNVKSLTVTPSDEQQVFDGVEEVEIYNTGLSAGTHTFTVDYSASEFTGVYLSAMFDPSSESVRMGLPVENGEVTYTDGTSTLTYSGNTITVECPNADGESTGFSLDGYTASVDGYLPVTVEAIPSEYVVPSGTFTVSEDGTHNIAQYESINVPKAAINVANVNRNINDNVSLTITGYTNAQTSVFVKALYSGSGLEVYATTTVGGFTKRLDLNSGTITPVLNKTLTIPAQPEATITPSTSSQTAIESGKFASGTVTVAPIPSQYIIPTGNKTITANGTGIDVAQYSTVDVNVASTINNQNKTVTPTESSQSVTADTGYTGLGTVTVNAIDSEYVGSDITRRSSSDLTASGATVTVPAGYYESQASKAVASGSATTPATSITANPSISVSEAGLITATASATKAVTPTVSAGYVSAGTQGTVTVSGSNTSQMTVQAAKTVTPSETEQTAVAKGVYTTGVVKVGAIPSTYVGSGVAQNDSTDLTASGATVTVPAGFYAEDASKSVATTTHPDPTVSVNSSGLITATHNQGTGYVTAGTTTGTLQLTTQAAKTITPTKSSQTAVASGVYTTGAVTVAAIPSQYITTTDATATASDIVSGETAYVDGSKVTGSLVIQHYYTGSSAPASTLGANGDIYLQV